MMKETISGNDDLTLALETAVGSGSVALLRGGVPISVSADESRQASRAEDLLQVIKAMLDEAGIKLEDLKMIAVSTGPGSYSGIRIGLATAIGLKNALRIPCVGVSVLEALASGSTLFDPIVAAVPVGKNDVAWQRFESVAGSKIASTDPKLSSLAEFRQQEIAAMIAPREFLDRIGRDNPKQDLFVDTPLAVLIGRSASADDSARPLKPLYLRAGAGFKT
jgi:tRNA threonylcarbamoyl adenosine modification protein YeaZ